MGTLHYGNWDFRLDDRVLAHLQVVISLKLRRSESFFLSWVPSPDSGAGRRSIWVDNGVALYCQFDGTRPISINREWVESLSLAANSATGLVVTSEPPQHGAPAH